MLPPQLKQIIVDYRLNHPEDLRSEEELFRDFLDWYAKRPIKCSSCSTEFKGEREQ